MGGNSIRTFQIKLNFYEQIPMIFLIINSHKPFSLLCISSVQFTKVKSFCKMMTITIFFPASLFNDMMLWLLSLSLSLCFFQGFIDRNPLETYPLFPFLKLCKISANDGNLHINRLNGSQKTTTLKSQAK